MAVQGEGAKLGMETREEIIRTNLASRRRVEFCEHGGYGVSSINSRNFVTRPRHFCLREFSSPSEQLVALNVFRVSSFILSTRENWMDELFESRIKKVSKER